MATKFVTNLNLLQNQIINGRFEVVENDPTTGNFEGRLIYNSTQKVIKVYTGSVWRTALHAVTSSTTALTSSESSGTISLSIADATTSVSGLMSSSDKSKLDGATATNTNSTLVMRDAAGRFKATDPSADQDVATKAYVDAARAGLDVKQSVRAATTEDIALDNTTTGVDGVTPLVDGDRILVKNQDPATENGIYVVSTTGAWSRATDADTTGELTSGSFVFVEQGTANADSGWVVSTDGTITIGSTAIAFAQFSGAGQITAGNGLTKAGNILNVGGTSGRISVTADAVDIDSTYVGQATITTLGTITTGTWNGVDIAVADGGTGASTASNARTNLADTTTGFNTSTPVLARVSARTIGDGTTLTYSITHNFGTRDVIVQIFDTATYDTVFADVVRTTTDAVEITFSAAPASNAYRVVVSG